MKTSQKDRFEIRASDRTRLFVRTWGEASTASAGVIIVHGLGEHIGRYEYLAKKCTERGLFVLGYDQRGHGQSKGKRGHIPSTRQLMADIRQAIHLAASYNPAMPLFLYGHSMGALEVLYYALKHQPELAGVIATSPPLDESVTSKGQETLTRILNPIFPRLSINNGIKQWALSRDAAVAAAYQKDKYVHSQVSVRLGNFLIKGRAYVQEHAPEWKLPLYLAHGTADEICPIAGSDIFFQRANGPIKYMRWDGLYHETHNEPEKNRVIGTMLDWINSQC
jgi:acylglycerol lipase